MTNESVMTSTSTQTNNDCQQQEEQNPNPSGQQQQEQQRLDRRSLLHVVQRSFRLRRKKRNNKILFLNKIANKFRGKRNSNHGGISTMSDSFVFVNTTDDDNINNKLHYKGTDNVVFEPPAVLSQNNVNLDREEKRLESFDIYILVSILSCTSSFATIQGSSHDVDNDDMTTICIHYLAIFCSVASFLTGIFATIIFSLYLLYSKTALGMNRDEMYDHFTKSTVQERLLAFRAFSMSLWLFIVELVLVAAAKLSWFKWPFMLITSLCGAFVIHSMHIMSEKGNMIFATQSQLSEAATTKTTNNNRIDSMNVNATENKIIL